MKKVKGFSYDTEKDMDIIKHIEKQPHQANYIINLVRKDIQQNSNEIENIVRKCVKKILKDKNIEIKSNENSINKNDINQLLNIKGVKK
mgnify:CR=1 FL=1